VQTMPFKLIDPSGPAPDYEKVLSSPDGTVSGHSRAQHSDDFSINQ